jgi:general stress protein 26
MTLAQLLVFLRSHRHAVQASVGGETAPQAAVVAFAVTDRAEIVFDTLGTTRKAQNLRRNPRIALVIGWDDEQTVQLEGTADEPTGAELERVRAFYFEAIPDGPTRLPWPGITYVRVVPSWIRYSDFRASSRRIVEWSGPGLAPVEDRDDHGAKA